MADPRFDTGDPIMDAALAADDAKLAAMGAYLEARCDGCGITETRGWIAATLVGHAHHCGGTWRPDEPQQPEPHTNRTYDDLGY